MKIYVSHSHKFNFQADLYRPLKSISEVDWVFPHESSSTPYPILDLLKSKTLNAVLAEVSYPSTGQGIELGWANQESVRIICLYRAGVEVSNALRMISAEIFKYENTNNLIELIVETLRRDI